MTDTSPSRLRALVELTAAVGIAFGTKALLDPYIWKFSGPVSLAIILTLATVYLHRTGETWSGLGLRKLPGWKSVLLVIPQTLLGVVAILGTGIATGLLVSVIWPGAMADTQAGVDARWGDIQGNLPVYLLWLFLGWVSGGFGEELFFRAFLISRAEKLFRGLTPGGLFLAILVPAFVFGFGHFYYQGLRGLFTTGMIGLALGVLYLLYKRNLWPLILAHGLVDSLGFTAMYLDADW